ncbi:MAG: hypothetical protein NTV00_09520 [Methylococcales bacterium]|nr:hypothetical protein [Methylococcales bacterium]
MKRSVLGSILLLTLSSLVLTGCEQAQTTAKVNPPPIRKYAEATVIEGAVSNNTGIIKTGTLDVTDEKGHSITHAAVDNGHFNVEIPANTLLPILLTVTPEPAAEKLVAVVLYETINKYYINPTSTAIAAAAKSFGGYTRANLDRAAENTVHVPDSNKTSAGWRGDPTTQYGGWH